MNEFVNGLLIFFAGIGLCTFLLALHFLVKYLFRITKTVTWAEDHMKYEVFIANGPKDAEDIPAKPSPAVKKRQQQFENEIEQTIVEQEGRKETPFEEKERLESEIKRFEQGEVSLGDNPLDEIREKTLRLTVLNEQNNF